MKRHVTLIPAAAAAAVIAVTCGSNAQPAPGDPCPTPGSVYTHGNNRLACGQDGKWHK